MTWPRRSRTVTFDRKQGWVAGICRSSASLASGSTGSTVDAPGEDLDPVPLAQQRVPRPLQVALAQPRHQTGGHVDGLETDRFAVGKPEPRQPRRISSPTGIRRFRARLAGALRWRTSRTRVLASSPCRCMAPLNETRASRRAVLGCATEGAEPCRRTSNTIGDEVVDGPAEGRPPPLPSPPRGPVHPGVADPPTSAERGRADGARTSGTRDWLWVHIPLPAGSGPPGATSTSATGGTPRQVRAVAGLDHLPAREPATTLADLGFSAAASDLGGLSQVAAPSVAPCRTSLALSSAGRPARWTQQKEDLPCASAGEAREPGSAFPAAGRWTGAGGRVARRL